MNKINSHFLKLTGKAELPEEISIGHNYGLILNGSITAITESDNHDSTFNRMYRFEPVLIEVITERGKTLKLKDVRSSSQLWRGRVWKFWNTSKSDVEFDQFYKELMKKMIENFDEIIGHYGMGLY